MKIPDIFHFCFGLQGDFGGKPFSLIHYLALRSAYEVNRPQKIFLYYKYEPSGPWWEKSRGLMEEVKIEPPKSIFGNPLRNFSHQSDVLRLQLLLEHGGIYLDMDVICLKPLKPLFDYDCVLGKQSDEGLCNAVILAAKGSEFLERWLKTYVDFVSQDVKGPLWAEHSVRRPFKLARERPELVHLESDKSFFWPTYHNPDVFWSNADLDFSKSYCVHLWEQLWWEDYLKKITPEYLKIVNNNFTKICRPFSRSL
jgi:hypothetical protein